MPNSRPICIYLLIYFLLYLRNAKPAAKRNVKAERPSLAFPALLEVQRRAVRQLRTVPAACVQAHARTGLFLPRVPGARPGREGLLHTSRKQPQYNLYGICCKLYSLRIYLFHGNTWGLGVHRFCEALHWHCRGEAPGEAAVEPGSAPPAVPDSRLRCPRGPGFGCRPSPGSHPQPTDPRYSPFPVALVHFTIRVLGGVFFSDSCTRIRIYT